MELYLISMIQQVDSTLLDEWERMRDPNYRPRGEKAEVRPPGAEEADRDITRDTKAFTAAIRNRIFIFLRGVVNSDYDQALAALASSEKPDGESWTADRLRQALEAYQAEHDQICLDPNARNVRYTYVLPAADKRSWRIQQMLIDRHEHNDWVAEFDVDLAQSRASGEPALRLLRMGSLV
jgi:hypothetical protein